MIEKIPFDDFRPNDSELNHLIQIFKEYANPQMILDELSHKNITYFEIIREVLNNKEKTNYFIDYLNKFNLNKEPINLTDFFNKIKYLEPMAIKIYEILVQYKIYRDK